MHRVTTSEANVGSPMYSRERHHGSQLVTMHDQKLVLIDCCVNAFDKSSKVDQWHLKLVIQLNTVTLEQSEP